MNIAGFLVRVERERAAQANCDSDARETDVDIMRLALDLEDQFTWWGI